MKAILCTLTLVAMFGLTACHANRDKPVASDGPAASSSAPASGTAKAIEKSRNAMMDKSMDIQSEHWASTPAASSTTASSPAATPGTTAPPTVATPAATPPAAPGSGH